MSKKKLIEIKDDIHSWLAIKRAETGEAMLKIVDRVLRKEMDEEKRAGLLAQE